MKFIEALKALDEGKKIKVSGCHNSWYYVLDHNKTIRDSAGFPATIGYDAFTLDWEIVEDKIEITEAELGEAVAATHARILGGMKISEFTKEVFQILKDKK